MTSQVQSSLLKILTIIRYSKSKKAFIEEFENLNRDETLVNLLDTLPSDARKAIQDAKHPELALRSIVGNEVYEQELMEVSKNALNAFVDVIKPIVSLQQREEIHEVLTGKFIVSKD